MPKFLVVRFSSIGDIILTTPVVRCIKKQISNAEVHFLTKKSFTSLLLDNPYIDRVLSIESSVFELKDELKKEKYDFVIDLHHNLRSLQVKQICNTSSASFPKMNLEKWLLVNFKKNLMPDEHVVDRYFKAASKLGVSNDGEGLDFFFPGGIEAPALPEQIGKAYVAIVIGAKFRTKKYPAAKVRQVCQMIDRPVVLIGGKEDAEDAKVIAEGLSNVYDACGIYNFQQSALLVRNASVVIANDTGFMHIAAALKKPVVSVWGNTVPEFGMYPYLAKDQFAIIERKDVKCRPCSKIGYQECPRSHFNCMNLIEPAEVVKAAEKFLSLSK